MPSLPLHHGYVSKPSRQTLCQRLSRAAYPSALQSAQCTASLAAWLTVRGLEFYLNLHADPSPPLRRYAAHFIERLLLCKPEPRINMFDFHRSSLRCVVFDSFGQWQLAARRTPVSKMRMSGNYCSKLGASETQFALWPTLPTNKHASTERVRHDRCSTCSSMESKPNTKLMCSDACSGGGLHEAQRHKASIMSIALAAHAHARSMMMLD